MKRTEDLWRTLQCTNEWLRYSDTKATALLGIQGILLGIFGTHLHSQVEPQSKAEWIVLCVACALNVLSILFSFLCLNPRLKLKGGLSPFYFGSIAQNFSHSGEYENHVAEALEDDSDLAHELCGQIYVNSCIADRKFRHVTHSLRLFASSLLVWATLVVFSQ